MKKFFVLGYVAIFLLIPLFNSSFGKQVNAQNISSRCGVEPSDAEVIELEELFKKEKEKTDITMIEPLAKGGNIEVYFHILNAGPKVEDGNIPNERIFEQINVLNRAYAPGGWTFHLDPSNIDRTTDESWFYLDYHLTPEYQMKRALHKGNVKDLNIYSCDLEGVIGWATFPADYKRKPRYFDGIVIHFKTLPQIPGVPLPNPDYPYGLGETATHEVGHWLGLYHTFQGWLSG